MARVLLTFEQSDDSWTIFLLTSHATDADDEPLSGALGSNFGCGGNDAIVYYSVYCPGDRRGWRRAALRRRRLLRDDGTRHVHGKGQQRTGRYGVGGDGGWRRTGHYYCGNGVVARARARVVNFFFDRGAAAASSPRACAAPCGVRGRETVIVAGRHSDGRAEECGNSCGRTLAVAHTGRRRGYATRCWWWATRRRRYTGPYAAVQVCRYGGRTAPGRTVRHTDGGETSSETATELRAGSGAVTRAAARRLQHFTVRVPLYR